MDQPKHTTLVEGLSTLIDPRKARGKRYGWMLLLTLIAIASGQRTVHAIADWIALHWEDVRTELHPMRTTCPSESTFRRALRLIDAQGMEDLLTHWDAKPSLPPPVMAVAPPLMTPAPLHAQAVDGKELYT